MSSRSVTSTRPRLSLRSRRASAVAHDPAVLKSSGCTSNTLGLCLGAPESIWWHALARSTNRDALRRIGMRPSRLAHIGMRVSPTPTSLRRTRTCSTRRLRALSRRPQTSPRHDHRRASCSVTVPQTPPGSPARSEWRITAEAYHGSFLQVKALWKAMQPRPGSSDTPYPR
jgi:hypothetical protein